MFQGDESGLDSSDGALLIYHKYQTPVISTAASSALRDVLLTPGNLEDLGELACLAVERQLSIYNESLEEAQKRSVAIDATLFDSVTAKIAQSIGENPEEDIKAILTLPPSVARRAIWKWEKIPYVALCAAQNVFAQAEDHKDSPSGATTSDVDEWILSNERWLRDDRHEDWTRGLVRFSSHADLVFRGSTLSSFYRTINRDSVTGYTILDTKRAPSIQIQPSIERFKTTFDLSTDNLLKGLNWENVFIAGGIVLGTLLSTDTEKDLAKYKHSDIDVYLYGLQPVDANRKISHIYEVWKSNLPSGAPSFVVRNSRTITVSRRADPYISYMCYPEKRGVKFFSSYPTKRIQIVLKLVRDPKEVLLNFDLDICSMGWEGSKGELYLLPRAVRALQTGYNVFTMNLVHGHYLGERRASQEQRVFKYADKGYGIRILPSYVQALKRYDDDLTALGVVESFQHLDMDAIAKKADFWTRKLVDVRWEPENRASNDPPLVSHSDLTERKLKTTEPLGRSCLTGFERLMRHVSLWNLACEGVVVIQDNVFASEDYDEQIGPVGYEEGPTYEWSKQFDETMFKESIIGVNRRERSQLETNLSKFMDINIWGKNGPSLKDTVYHAEEIRRMAVGSTLEEVLGPQGDSIIPLFVPKDFITFANRLVLEALKDHGLPATEPLLVPALKRSEEDRDEIPDNLVVVFWKIDATRAWQLIDRRIDEVYEVLWAFHGANAEMDAAEEDRTRLFKTQLSKRAIRRRPEDEFLSFARWIGRIPQRIGFSYSGNWYDTGNGGDDDWEW